MKKKFVNLLLLLTVVASCSKNNEEEGNNTFITSDKYPQDVFSTADASEVCCISARLNATIDNNRLGLSNYTLDFQISQSEEFNSPKTVNQYYWEKNENYTYASNLEPERTYYYRAHIKGSNGDFYGDIKSFKTNAMKDEYIEGETSEIHCFTTKVPVAINFDKIGSCEKNRDYYVFYSTDSNLNPSDCIAEQTYYRLEWTDECSIHRDRITETTYLSPLNNNTNYYYQVVVEYTGLFGGKHIVCSKKYQITTKPYDVNQIGVDLGKYGVWAGCDMGAENPQERGPKYAYQNTNLYGCDEYVLPEGYYMTIQTGKYMGVDGYYLIGSNGNRVFSPGAYYWCKGGTMWNYTGGAWTTHSYKELRIRGIKK